jgi:5-methylcytosine-specific restriction endonuclease McrA
MSGGCVDTFYRRVLASPANGFMGTFLNQQVLVLNRLWQAVNVCTARRALTLLFDGHAQAVLSAPDGSFQTYSFGQWKDFSQQEPHPESIRTVSFRVRVPRVILLVLFDRLPKKEVKFTRYNIFERDKDTCQYCGRVFDRRDLNLDHVLPRDQGGAHHLGEHRLFVHRM